jgi:AcrR family transcriptional regulator
LNPSLRPGPNGLPRAQVEEIQRRRLIAAAIQAVEEFGYPRLTVAKVIGRARVSRTTFYEVFADREECFLAAFEQALSEARALASEAYEREPGWREGTRAALASVLMFMDEEPGLASLCVVEACAAGTRVLRRRAAVLDELAEFIDRARLTNSSCQPPGLTAEGVVGGIFAVLHTRISLGSDEPLTDLAGSLMSVIVLPYLGPKAARRELSRPAPVISQQRRRDHAQPKEPLEGLKMRLTYRTIRVLTAIAEQPGASNRALAADAGIVDQGQISKLLSRLRGLGLVENFGLGQEGGAPNAWRLTARGAQLEQHSRGQ